MSQKYSNNLVNTIALTALCIVIAPQSGNTIPHSQIDAWIDEGVDGCLGVPKSHPIKQRILRSQESSDEHQGGSLLAFAIQLKERERLEYIKEDRKVKSTLSALFRACLPSFLTRSNKVADASEVD